LRFSPSAARSSSEPSRGWPRSPSASRSRRVWRDPAPPSRTAEVRRRRANLAHSVHPIGGMPENPGDGLVGADTGAEPALDWRKDTECPSPPTIRFSRSCGRSSSSSPGSWSSRS
jgi:hypothetical protein